MFSPPFGRNIRADFDTIHRIRRNRSAIAKAIAGMLGRLIISTLISGSPFIPTIGDGPNTSTIGTAGANMRAAATGAKVAGSNGLLKAAKTLVAAGLEHGFRHLAFQP